MTRYLLVKPGKLEEMKTLIRLLMHEGKIDKLSGIQVPLFENTV